MKILRWLAVTFSMYSKIPMPRFEWQEDDMEHSLTFFPFVGAVIGTVNCLLNSLSPFKLIPVAIRIMLTILIPLVITGGFHVDGFMDTEDALNSYASKEKKLEILKDSHIGAFSVISLIKWLLAYAAAVSAVFLNEKCTSKVMVIFGMTFVLSRGLSGLTSLLFRKAKETGMLYEETKNKQKGTVICLVVQLILAGLVIIFMNVIYGIVVIMAYALYTLYYRLKIYKEFGGVTGDTAGFFLTTGEIVAASALAIAIYIF